MKSSKFTSKWKFPSFDKPWDTKVSPMARRAHSPKQQTPYAEFFGHVHSKCEHSIRNNARQGYSSRARTRVQQTRTQHFSKHSPRHDFGRMEHLMHTWSTSWVVIGQTVCYGLEPKPCVVRKPWYDVRVLNESGLDVLWVEERDVEAASEAEELSQVEHGGDVALCREWEDEYVRVNWMDGRVIHDSCFQMC